MSYRVWSYFRVRLVNGVTRIFSASRVEQGCGQTTRKFLYSNELTYNACTNTRKSIVKLFAIITPVTESPCH